jgi:small acid-soluble spore protein I (minor)
MQLNTLNLRQAIIQRVHDKSEDELTDVIESSIGNDERTLPGLGVLFELIWKDSDQPTQKRLVETLHHYLSHTKAPIGQ